MVLFSERILPAHSYKPQSFWSTSKLNSSSFLHCKLLSQRKNLGSPDQLAIKGHWCKGPSIRSTPTTTVTRILAHGIWRDPFKHGPWHLGWRNLLEIWCVAKKSWINYRFLYSRGGVSSFSLVDIPSPTVNNQYVSILMDFPGRLSWFKSLAIGMGIDTVTCVTCSFIDPLESL